ncbi:MAG: formyltetrahydrofolate deformylase [Pirellulales bacterium]|nr:formyltetrahydrofolate deformylase [Pirellulales bacterium]
MPQHLLLIHCADQPGLIHTITGVLFRRGFNIINNQEFVETAGNQFFMRTEFAGGPDPAAALAELQSLLPAGADVRLAVAAARPIVILATKEPHCLGDLLLRHAYGELPARIAAVVSNYDTLAPLARQFEIPFVHVSHLGCERAEHEAALAHAIAPFEPEYLILAKYMRVLSPDFVARWPRRIVNIHHSFLPAFVGANPYRQAYERGVKIIGATAHYVTADLDQGPIIAQGVQPVDHSYSHADMAQAGREVEKLVLAKALRLVLEERVFVYGNRTVVFE